MKVLFITGFFVHDNFGRDPLGILYLSSALKKAGHTTAVADGGNTGTLARTLETFNPDIAGFSVTTSTFAKYASLNKELKKIRPDIYSIFGGPHCTFYPEFFKDTAHIDAICLGEGEEAVVDFANRMEAGEKYEYTPNFHVRKNGLVIENDVRPLIRDLDSLAFPDRGLLRHIPSMHRFPVKTFMTTRGCPHDCTYCYNHALAELYRGKGARVRLRSVGNVLSEIKQELSRGKIDFVNFEDDIFGMDRKWLEEFSEKYPGEVGVPFCCNVRVEYVDEKSTGLLKKAGCHTCVMGVESGNYDIRRNILNRTVKNENIIQASFLIRKKGMILETENIIGLPGVSYEEEKETIELNIKCKPEYPASYMYQPFPRTVLGKKAIEQKMFDGDYSKIANYYNRSGLNGNNGKKLNRLRSLFYFVVRFPILYRYMDILTSLPLTHLYYFLHAFARGYTARFRMMPYGFKMSDFVYHLYRYFFCY